jgi:hypothetical protein
MSNLFGDRFLWGALLLLALLAVPQPVLASVDDGEPPPPADQQGNGDFMVNEANFDQWIFQGSGSAAAGHARLKSHLKLKLDELARVCNLTPAQHQKLSLAGHGDMKRFFDQVEVVRKKFLEVRNDQHRFNQIWQEISPLQQKQAAGLFNDSSMFAKTLRRTLADDQQAKYQAVVDERRRFRYRAMIEVWLVSLESSVALRHDQHEAILKLLIEETQPPLVFGQYDSHYVMYALSKLPAQKLKPIVDDRQWQLLQQQMQQGRGMEGFMAQNGIIDPLTVRVNPAVGILGAIFGEPAPAGQFARVRAVRIKTDAPADALEPENRTNKGKQ